MRHTPLAAVGLGLSVLGLSGLGLSGLGLSVFAPNAGAEQLTAGASGSITVFAASSLTDAFTKLGRDFQRSHPDTTISFSFNASSALATQIDEGAPVDVFASADATNMKKVVDAGAIGGRPVVFARNRLEIAVEPGNPLEIHSLADTVKSDVTLVLCAAVVPCGRYALDSYAKAGVQVREVPTAENAKATLAKVALGEADAAVVYVTDVAAAKNDADGVAIPERENVVAAYPIGVVKDTQNRALARAFSDYVTSSRGRRTLRHFAFLAP
ncbi:MAG: molybdate ABC transporter substrate-binding protein [Acidimicrobiia bacterium]|nr:molybdate ABC transporter substrate-binding protein [Acidimicrobiia bacterium]